MPHTGTGFLVNWFKHGVDIASDLRFSIPKARKDLKPHELPENRLSKEGRMYEQMMCPVMTPYKPGVAEE